MQSAVFAVGLAKQKSLLPEDCAVYWIVAKSVAVFTIFTFILSYSVVYTQIKHSSKIVHQLNLPILKSENNFNTTGIK